ncbi:GNAT family N-acetyltransferase [Natrialba sp. PRR66]|uniref:GNAT family N-acetyltransferase n=1 Tax=Natrialba sp. PRR66 TaxID=3098146 RepID=UPI002B1E262A|nr:GNAT family N-acetyltransferase [Natrialba sp. PRR66]
MADTESPRLATADDFHEMTALLDRHFAYERYGMAARLPFCYDSERSERHAIIEKDGEIVSHIAAIPQTLVVGEGTVECWGIGGVATDKRYRGNGYMSQLLEFWLDRMDDAGVPLSELSGNRQRYNHFGYENAGAELRYTISKRSFATTPEPAVDTVVTHDGSDAHLEVLRGIHGQEPYRVRRDRERSRITFGQRGLETLLYKDDSDPAYLSLTRESRSRTIKEFGGSEHGLEALLGHVLAMYDLNDLTACVHPRHPLDDVFHRHSRFWQQRPHRKLNIRDLSALLEAFEGQFERRWRDGDRTETGEISLALEEEEAAVQLSYGPGRVTVERVADDPDLSLDRISMTGLLFGFHDRKRTLRQQDPFLEATLPLQFYIWPTEHV